MSEEKKVMAYRIALEQFWKGVDAVSESIATIENRYDECLFNARILNYEKKIERPIAEFTITEEDLKKDMQQLFEYLHIEFRWTIRKNLFYFPQTIADDLWNYRTAMMHAATALEGPKKQEANIIFNSLQGKINYFLESTDCL